MHNNTTPAFTLTVEQLNELLKTTVNECLDIKNSKDEFIDREEMMKRLSMGATMLNEYTQNHTFPHYKIGKKVLYNWKEVREILKAFRSE